MSSATESTWAGSMPETYHRCLGPALFGPWALLVADAAARVRPQTVLELAAGTGVATSALIEALPGAQITATDLNPAMVEFGATTAPGGTWREADACRLPFPDRSFDLVICQFGVMFFPDKPAAFRETRRVLADGGTLLLTVWDRIETHGFASGLVAALDAVLPGSVPDFVARVPHGYADPELVRADTHAGGLAVESIERFVPRGSAPSAATIAEGFCFGTPLRFELEARGALDDLAARTADELTRILGPGQVQSDLAGYLVTARVDPST